MLCGKQLDQDVSIAYTGMRPGEKLHEQLAYDCETCVTRQAPSNSTGLR
jgi:FlaA1/EpsC-like NDP-sugar epimerase